MLVVAFLFFRKAFVRYKMLMDTEVKDVF